jgi:hypothetical protein
MLWLGMQNYLFGQGFTILKLVLRAPLPTSIIMWGRSARTKTNDPLQNEAICSLIETKDSAKRWGLGNGGLLLTGFDRPAKTSQPKCYVITRSYGGSATLPRPIKEVAPP